MAKTTPMDVLRDLADKALGETTTALGKAQLRYSKAATQLSELESYEQEYQQLMQETIVREGMSVVNLIAHSAFIDSLNNVVQQHASHVATCRTSVDQTLQIWQQDKQRLNAFETLKSRADSLKLQQEARLEQKIMDEFAQRASLRKEDL